MGPPSLVPRFAFLTKGVGTGPYRLAAFDAALREAGVAGQNLVPVSSVFPPSCQLIPREEGVKMLQPGQVTFVVMARRDSSHPDQQIAAAIGLAVATDGAPYGYIAEHDAEGEDEKTASRHAEELGAVLLGAKLGVSPTTIHYKMKTGIAQAARVLRDPPWSSVVALCVFVV